MNYIKSLDHKAVIDIKHVKKIMNQVTGYAYPGLVVMASALAWIYQVLNTLNQ
jgi:hypothetical protein